MWMNVAYEMTSLQWIPTQPDPSPWLYTLYTLYMLRCQSCQFPPSMEISQMQCWRSRHMTTHTRQRSHGKMIPLMKKKTKTGFTTRQVMQDPVRRLLFNITSDRRRPSDTSTSSQNDVIMPRCRQPGLLFYTQSYSVVHTALDLTVPAREDSRIVPK